MEDGNNITQIFLPLSLAFIMFSVGLELTFKDFQRITLRPKDFIIGTFSQMVILPIVAFAILSILTIEPALAVGVMIIAACPGGVTSNLFTYLARGDTALSVSLTAIISLLAVFTLPLIVNFSIFYFMDSNTVLELSIINSVIGIFTVTTVPVILGMLLNHYAPTFTKEFDRFARIIASILFLIIIIGAVISERANFINYFKQAGLVTLSLNWIMMSLALFITTVCKFGDKQKTAVVLECGLQNGTLAIFVAATLIGSKTMMVPGAIYSLLMFPTAIAYIIMVIRRR